MNRAGICFAAIQFFFVTTWTVYVLYLPKLAAQAGIPKEWVVFLLLADQLVFAAVDLAMGIAADRVARSVGRLARWMLGLTAVSCIAFLLLPWLAPGGSPALFIAVTFLWTLTSSALRAPPLALLGKYVPPPSVPWIASLLLLGMGIAGAVAPYLTVSLRDADPRVPFALSSLALFVAVSGVLWAERNLARLASPPQPPAAPMSRDVLLFFGAVALLALGFQVHSALNTAPEFLRFARPVDLEHLLPVFWIGFNLLMLPASLAARRFGGLPVMGVAGLAGALAVWLAAHAPSLSVLVAAQFLAGGAWGVMLMSAVTAAVSVGRTGREGAATGGLAALLALAAFVRIAFVAAGMSKEPGYAAFFAGLPPLAWALAGALLAALALRAHAPSATKSIAA